VQLHWQNWQKVAGNVKMGVQVLIISTVTHLFLVHTDWHPDIFTCASKVVLRTYEFCSNNYMK
jgi:hypothetical protein